MEKLFATKIFKDRLLRSPKEVTKLNRQLLSEIEDIVALDRAGEEWSKQNYSHGFTSYASANELHRTSSTFAKLESILDRHVQQYARALDFDLNGVPLKMSTCWVNVMRSNAHHGSHIHPLSVISGTYYIALPPGSSAIKFEDPRLPFFMHAPPKRKSSRKENKTHIELPAKAGDFVLFESWLRHEVPWNRSRFPRVSVSFNYAWDY